MNFELPVASRQRLDELLEYIGDRAEDFKKCFDIESEWCWKYADLVLRGVSVRSIEYGERHHIIPMAWFSINGYRGDRWGKKVTTANLSTLTYVEHIYAHYCLAQCVNEQLQGKLAFAFWCMYNNSHKNYKGNIRNLHEADLLPRLTVLEEQHIKLLIPSIAKVEAEGRTHLYEDEHKYKHDYHVANRSSILPKKKVYAEEHKDDKKEYDRVYSQLPEVKARRKERYELNKTENAPKRRAKYAENKDHINELRRQRNALNRDTVNEKHREYCASHRDAVNSSARKSYQAHKETRLAQDKIYRTAHKEEITIRNKKYHETHKDSIHQQQKTYCEKNKDRIHSRAKQHYDEMVAKGYRYLTNHTTGKRGWVFVGIQRTEVA